MQLLAVRQARLLAFFNSEELNPSGRPLVPDFMNAFVQRYGFLKYPQKVEDLDDEKGITFETGRWNDIGIVKLVMFSWGIVVDTSASTDASEGMLQDALAWAAETYGFSNRPDLITRRAYVSELIVTSDWSLPTINPALQVLSSKINDSISKHFRISLQFEISGINFHFDTLHSKQFFSAVRIERLGETPYSDNKYYAGAPMPTHEHVALLEEFEAALKA